MKMTCGHKEGNDESIVASQQFLISFVATVFGTLIGAVGLLLTIWSMLPASMWWRCSTIIIMVVGVLFGIFKFYCWAVRHMLSSRQRAVLEEKYHFDFD
jgi:membrane protein YdbS with pleckstrin-like domain